MFKSMYDPLHEMFDVWCMGVGSAVAGCCLFTMGGKSVHIIYKPMHLYVEGVPISEDKPVCL